MAQLYNAQELQGLPGHENFEFLPARMFFGRRPGNKSNRRLQDSIGIITTGELNIYNVEGRGEEGTRTAEGQTGNLNYIFKPDAPGKSKKRKVEEAEDTFDDAYDSIEESGIDPHIPKRLMRKATKKKKKATKKKKKATKKKKKSKRQSNLF